jgi:hypothetical protein
LSQRINQQFNAGTADFSDMGDVAEGISKQCSLKSLLQVEDMAGACITCCGEQLVVAVGGGLWALHVDVLDSVSVTAVVAHQQEGEWVWVGFLGRTLLARRACDLPGTLTQLQPTTLAPLRSWTQLPRPACYILGHHHWAMTPISSSSSSSSQMVCVFNSPGKGLGCLFCLFFYP